MDSIEQLKEQQDLIAKVRNSGAPDAAVRADALWNSYHDVQMAKVSTDVYKAAEGAGQSSIGWKRASVDPAALADIAQQLKLEPEVLADMLRPNRSGFRAEIYVPDPEVLGPGFKPVFAFKGSAGNIVEADGTMRDTTFEDFLANDFTQASGLRADYFDRAMKLASVVRDAGFDCEGAGHSLGGGTASAFTAVSGRPSTTFNAAGLHPETTRRFAEENPGIRIHDVSKSVRAYEVSGELLNDGLQDSFPTMNAARRAQIGDVIEELSIGLKTFPGAQRFIEQRLEATGMPDHAVEATRGWIDLLASRDAGTILAELPAASGSRQPALPAMTGQEGNLLKREAMIGLPELVSLAGPLINVAHVGVRGARTGRAVGEAAADVGDTVGTHIQRGGVVIGGTAALAGHVVEQASLQVNETAVASVEVAGRSAAGVRHLAGEASAAIDGLQGKAQASAASLGADAIRSVSGLLPDGLKRDAHSAADAMERRGEQAQREQASEARATRVDAAGDAAAIRGVARTVERSIAAHAHTAAELNRDVIVGPGVTAARASQAAATGIKAVGGIAPGLGMQRGAEVGVAIGAAIEVGQGLPNQVRMASAAVSAIPVGSEAAERHKMVPTGLPSMEAYFERQQADAREWLRQQTRTAPSIEEERAAPPSRRSATDAAPSLKPSAQTGHATDPRDPTHADHASYQEIRRTVASDGRWTDGQSTNIAAHLLGKFKAEAPGERLGMAVVGRPLDNGDVNVFAVTAFAGPGGGQRVAVSA